jgi:purine-binding chemotaxis protein CheW
MTLLTSPPSYRRTETLGRVTGKESEEMQQIKQEQLSGRNISQDEGIKTKKEGKYLTFSLNNEEYGIEILKVKEIIGMMAITTIPQTPPYVKGVVNLRGKVIPVIDLRLKFGMEAASYTGHTCIIVVEITGRSRGNFFIGIVVDTVSEVLNVKEMEIEETPDFGARMNTAYILGLAKMGSGVKILLEIDKVLSGDELDILNKAA